MNDVQREIATPAEQDRSLPRGEERVAQHDDSAAKEPKRLL
jgi:hypothetical protein